MKPYLYAALAAALSFGAGWLAHRCPKVSVSVAAPAFDAGVPETTATATAGKSESGAEQSVTITTQRIPPRKPRKVLHPDGGVWLECPDCPEAVITVHQKCESETGEAQAKATAPVLPPTVVTLHEGSVSDAPRLHLFVETAPTLYLSPSPNRLGASVIGGGLYDFARLGPVSLYTGVEVLTPVLPSVQPPAFIVPFGISVSR